MQYQRADALYPLAMKELRHPPRGAALPWMPKMTHYLGGLRPHEVTLLCAPTGTGKTELLATIAAQLGLAGIPTFAAPVETGGVDFMSRVIATVAKKNVNHGVAVDPDQLQEIEQNHAAKICAQPLFIANYDNRVQVREIQNVLEFAHAQDGVQVALLDNLNFFLEIQRASDAILEMDHAIHELVMFSKRIPIHTILVVHPKKTDGGRVESEFDIKGSSTAVQEAANVALFNRPTTEQIEQGHQPHHRELIFRKIRKRGYFTNKPIWLSYQEGHYTEIENGAGNAIRRSTKGVPYVPYGDD